MGILNILKWSAALATVLTGAVALLRPQSIQGFIGLNAVGGRGITEIRSIFGGLFIALGLAPLLLQDAGMFRMLGVAYAGIAAARAVATMVDRSVERSNLISLVVEIVFAVILVW